MFLFRNSHQVPFRIDKMKNTFPPWNRIETEKDWNRYTAIVHMQSNTFELS